MIELLDIEKPSEKRQVVRNRILKEIYGEMPQKPIHLSCHTKEVDESFAAGKATLSHQDAILDIGEKDISFPFTSIIPNGEAPCPAIVFLSFERSIPNKYLPAEEIIDRGYAIFSICLDDVSSNNGNFKSGISAHITGSRRKKYSSGKLNLWAWAMMRVVDYICDLECIDKSSIIVAGHGVGARAAILAGGFDDRVSYVIANGMTARPFPIGSTSYDNHYTASENSHLYSPAFVSCPYINEYMAILQICTGKYILIGSAKEGENFFPHNEYMSLYALSSDYYVPEGRIGIPLKAEIPTSEVKIQEGDISYHIRTGKDYFSREDWKIYLDYIDAKIMQNRKF